MATKWAHLPNATHIDWVIASIKTNPDVWVRPARRSAWDAAGAAAMVRARDAARDAVLVLIAYDDCEKFLDMTPDELQVWAVLSNDPAAILLLPMVQVMQKECADLPA